MKKRLHIYGQNCNHDHVFIVGDRESLTALGKAIVSALTEGKGNTTCFVADGERFETEVYLEEGNDYWGKSSLPYTDKNSFVDQEDAIGTWDLYGKHHPK